MTKWRRKSKRTEWVTQSRHLSFHRISILSSNRYMYIYITETSVPENTKQFPSTWPNFFRKIHEFSKISKLVKFNFALYNVREKFSYLLELFLVLNFFLEVKHDFLSSLLKINRFQFVQSICDGIISKMYNSKPINSWWELWKIMLDFQKKNSKRGTILIDMRISL